MSGVVVFFWSEGGRPRYARVPRDEIRSIVVHGNTIQVALTGLALGSVTVPFDGSEDDDQDNLGTVTPWGDDPQIAYHGHQLPDNRSFSHHEWLDKIFEALTSPIDTDATFRWVGTTWEYTEGRP